MVESVSRWVMFYRESNHEYAKRRAAERYLKVRLLDFASAGSTFSSPHECIKTSGCSTTLASDVLQVNLSSASSLPRYIDLRRDAILDVQDRTV